MTIGFAPAFWVTIYNFTKALETAVCRGGHSAGPGERPGMVAAARKGSSAPRAAGFGRISAAARTKTRANPTIGRLSDARRSALATIGSGVRDKGERGREK